MNDEVPAVQVGQIWERTRYNRFIQVEVVCVDQVASTPNRTYWRVRGERGSTVRADRFDGKQFRFIQGPTS